MSVNTTYFERYSLPVVMILRSKTVKESTHISANTKFLLSEVVVRGCGVASSILGTMDAIYFAANGIQKGGLWLRGGEKAPEFEEVSYSFKRAFHSIVVASIGSVAITVWPSFITYFTYEESAHLVPLSSELKEKIQQIETYANQGESDKIQEIWNRCKVKEKGRIIEQLNEGDATVRRVCAPLFFKPSETGHVVSTNLWISPKERDEALGDMPAPLKEVFYFHGTPEFYLDSILMTKKINVMHSFRFPGAFVSMRPNPAFGDYIFGFRKNIEYSSTLQNGLRPLDNTDFWAGFSKAIPVVEETLACIILVKGDEDARQKVEEKCQEITLRKIPVYLLTEVTPHLEKIHQLMMGIPKEWPENSL